MRHNNESYIPWKRLINPESQLSEHRVLYLIGRILFYIVINHLFIIINSCLLWNELFWAGLYSNKEFLGGFEHEGICLTWYAPLRPMNSQKSWFNWLKIWTSLDWTKNVSMDEEWCSTKGIKWKENHSRLLNLSHTSVTTWIGRCDWDKYQTVYIWHILAIGYL